MKLLSWNILHGGTGRRQRIVDALRAHNPDVIALSEFRAAPGAWILAALAPEWPHSICAHAEGLGNGLCVISRTPLVRHVPCIKLPHAGGCWVDVELPAYGFLLGVRHILCSAPKTETRAYGADKVRYWNAVLRAARAQISTSMLLIGDWNSGTRRLDDERGKTLIVGCEQFDRLSELGWTDLWRERNPGPTEWTWYSRLKGGARGYGFRIDHAFASPPLHARVQTCRYSHLERDAAISDHSAVIIELA